MQTRVQVHPGLSRLATPVERMTAVKGHGGLGTHDTSTGLAPAG